MKTVRNLHEVMSASGPVLRGQVEVNGREFDLEADTDKTWLHITAEDGCMECCTIDADGDVVADSGECVTQDWTDADWDELTKVVDAK